MKNLQACLCVLAGKTAGGAAGQCRASGAGRTER